MLPELDGFEICKEIRRESDVPIIFITARTDERDILNGYALGCDDYVVKPFPLPVLYEKVNALIKRSKGLVRSKVFSSGGISLNPNNGIVVCDGEEVKLTAREYGILKVLLENKGIIISREIASQLSLHQYAADLTANAARKADPVRLARAVALSVEADTAIKHSYADYGPIERLICAL